MEYILGVVLIFGILFGYIITTRNKNQKFQNPAIKKTQLIQKYKNRIITSKTKDEKIKCLKQINQELSMNIFFSEIESKRILQDLSKLCI